MKNFACIAKSHLNISQMNGIKLTSYRPYQDAFDFFRNKLSTLTVLSNPDLNTSFIFDTDASNISVRAVLPQDGIKEHLGFASRSLTKSEKKYCDTRKELFAAVHFVKKLMLSIRSPTHSAYSTQLAKVACEFQRSRGSCCVNIWPHNLISSRRVAWHCILS